MVAVTATITNQAGQPLPDARVIVTLDRWDADAQGRVLVPQSQEWVADANGAVTMDLWPNELGNTASSYAFRAVDADGETLFVARGAVPDHDVELADIVDLSAFAPGRNLPATHEHANQSLLDTYTHTDAQIASALAHEVREDNPHHVTPGQIGAKAAGAVEPIASGGTGASTRQAAINALLAADDADEGDVARIVGGDVVMAAPPAAGTSVVNLAAGGPHDLGVGSIGTLIVDQLQLIPLNVACHPSAIYELSFGMTQGGGYAELLPNDTAYVDAFLNTYQSENGSFSQDVITEAFHFGNPYTGDAITARMMLSTVPAARSANGFTASNHTSGHRLTDFTSRWTDTTTPWDILGTIKFAAGPVSGVVSVRRLA